MVETKPIIVEIAAFTPNAAIAAARAGAHRVELCSGYSEGGLSPSAGTVLFVRNSVDILLHVMVRPRIGDFIYNDNEKECILNDISFCKSIGVDGVVVGALTSEGKLDKAFVKEVVHQAGPMSVTFHRAFDLLDNQVAALGDLVECGVHRVLTSGGRKSAVEGAAMIARLVAQAKGRIIILPGGGITSQNVNDLVRTTGVSEVHFSGKGLVKSLMYHSSAVSLTVHNQVTDNTWFECDASRVAAICKELE